jgi:hypothetical protein
MRRSNFAGALQYVPELTWILFLRIQDERESREAEEAEAVGAEFRPSLEAPFRWRDWATPGGPKRVELESGAMGDEGVLFRTNENAFVQTKRKLLDDCDLWCILSLPSGVFVSARAVETRGM